MLTAEQQHLMIDKGAMHEAEARLVEPPHIEPADFGADAAARRRDRDRRRLGGQRLGGLLLDDGPRVVQLFALGILLRLPPLPPLVSVRGALDRGQAW
jgi:hypothetical protein